MGYDIWSYFPKTDDELTNRATVSIMVDNADA